MLDDTQGKMKDSQARGDQNETPEDVATLYSWANVRGARYRDFSASRSEEREKQEQELKANGAERAGSDANGAVHRVMLPPTRPVRTEASREEQAIPGYIAGEPRVQEKFNGAIEPSAFTPAPPLGRDLRETRPAISEPARKMAGENEGLERPLPLSDKRDGMVRPSWLVTDREDAAPPVPQAPEDTLQGSRDKLTARWFALKSVFNDAPAPSEAAPVTASSRPPVVAVFSLAGGVGKTSLVATLGRTLSARGERVLLVDTASFGILPFFFGARDQRPGVLRTFTPPGTSGDAPIQTLAVEPESLGPETAAQEPLTQEIWRHGRGVGRILIDLATASGATTRKVLRMSPTVLVPLIPDMSSVVSVGSIDAFFQHNGDVRGRQSLPYYVLNQFDKSLPLHLDLREVLREQLGERLLPFVLRRTSAVSEALAEGMTVVDYAPNSPAAEDYTSLAGWVKSLAAPAVNGYRGVRWSER